jgi:hypothetical protein
MYLLNATTTYVGKFGGLLPGAYTICMTAPRAPLTNPTWTHKLQDSITHWHIHRKTCFSSCSSSCWCVIESLSNFASLRAIGIFKDWSVNLLWLSTRMFVAKRWIEVSNL